MSQRYFIFDAGQCFGCFGCVAACAEANATLPLHWRTVLKLPPAEGRSDTRWLSMACNHCAEAPCVAACPSRALIKRTSDGVVLHEPQRCLGCRYCAMACPYDAIVYDAAAGVVAKCHFCHERLAEGRDPACVEVCFAGALRQVVVESDEELQRYARALPGFNPGKGSKPAVVFVAGDNDIG